MVVGRTTHIANSTVIVRLVSMVNPSSRITEEVPTSWLHMLTRVSDVGVRKFDNRITMACDLLPFE